MTNSSPGGGTSTSQVFTVNLPAPTLTGLSPVSGNRLETLDVVFTGTNFISGLTNPNPGAGITVRSVSVTSSTSLIASLEITPSAATGARTFSVSNGSLISNTQTFTVNNPVPTLTSLSPAFGVAGQTLDVIFTGTNFINGMSVNISSDFTVNSVVVTSPTSFTVNFSISPLAAPGPRSFSVANPGPGGGTSNSLPFTITRITLTSLTPNTGSRLQRLNVVFAGTNFPPGAPVNPGNDIAVNSILATSATSITADLTIGANAATGPRDFSVGSTATGGISNTLSFTVTNPPPTLTSLSPASGNRLQPLDVVFTGDNFFRDTSKVNVGTGITVNSTRVTSLTSLTANITITPAATAGQRFFTVTNSNSGGVSSGVSFTVNNPVPALISVNPASGVIGQTIDVIITGMNFFPDATTPNPGTGIRLNSHSVTSPTTLAANITITPAATAGPKLFSVTNSGPGGGTSGTQIFTVNNPLPILDNIAPASGNRLQTLDVVFTGNNFFNDASTPEVGSGIMVVSKTVSSDATSLTAIIMIAAEAAIGPRDFFISNASPGGGSSAKKTFTVNNPAPMLTSINPTSGGLGQILDVTFTGTNFINGVTNVICGNDITVTPQTVTSSTSMPARITIALTATPGTRSFFVINSGPGGGTSSAQAFTISNNRAPDISHTPLPPQPEKQDMIIPATITDDSGTPSATLQYRAGGEMSFTAVAMTNTGSAYRGTIPGSAVGPRGVEYFISATDGEQSARAPIAGNFLTLILVTNVVRASPQTAGDAATSYRLVSVPIQATNPSVAAILADDLGAYDNTKWRLYGLIAGQPLSDRNAYVEVSESGAFAPGKSFFLIVRESGKTIDSDGGQSIRTDREYAIPLQTGHNFVATPFNFTIPLGKLHLKSGNVSLNTYQGNWITASELSPWEGYYLANNSTAAETLFVNPNLSSSAIVSKKDEGAANESAWRVQILASCGQARDTENFAGVAPASNDDYDFNDLAEPPPIGEYVSVYFPHPEWRKPLERYSDDMRAMSNPNQQWRFMVESNLPNEIVNLRFEGLREIDASLAIVLVDEALQFKQNLRENAVYQYQLRQRDNAKAFTLIVGKEAFVSEQTATAQGVPENFVLEQNFPNPFSARGSFGNPETAIRFGLPEKSVVTIKIFDLAGHEVTTLLDRAELPAGRHQRLWNGRDGQGRVVTSGIYFCQLTTENVAKTVKVMMMR